VPNHDYFCPSCKLYLRNQYRSVQEGGKARLPTCTTCGLPMLWVVPLLRMSLATDGESRSKEKFQKFMARDGRNNLVEIDSIQKLRQVERESEQLARDGEGQHITFRAFSQDGSNRDVNTHGEPEKPQLSAEAKRKWGLRGATSVVESEPDAAYGPGINDSNTSALPVD
jgi:hypothetical protein